MIGLIPARTPLRAAAQVLWPEWGDWFTARKADRKDRLFDVEQSMRDRLVLGMVNTRLGAYLEGVRVV